MTENELLEALRAATVASDSGAMTTRELCAGLGMSPSWVQRRIVALIEAGRVECVRKVARDVTGRQIPQPAYRPVT